MSRGFPVSKPCIILQTIFRENANSFESVLQLLSADVFLLEKLRIVVIVTIPFLR